jgi:hypothetical protein
MESPAIFTFRNESGNPRSAWALEVRDEGLQALSLHKERWKGLRLACDETADVLLLPPGGGPAGETYGAVEIDDSPRSQSRCSDECDRNQEFGVEGVW